MHCCHNIFIFKDSLPGVAYLILWCCLEPLPGIKTYSSRCCGNAIGKQGFSQQTTSEFICSCAQMQLQVLTLENKELCLLDWVNETRKLVHRNREGCCKYPWCATGASFWPYPTVMHVRGHWCHIESWCSSAGTVLPQPLSLALRALLGNPCTAGLVWMCLACFQWWLDPFHNFFRQGYHCTWNALFASKMNSLN